MDVVVYAFQSPGPPRGSRPRRRFGPRLAEIETGTLLNVRTREQVLLQGVLVRRDADRVVLGVDVLDDVSMDASRVETLWIDAGDKSSRGGREYHHWREPYPEPPLAGGNGSR